MHWKDLETGGGNVTLGPLQVLYYIVSAETENGLNLQTFVYGDAPMGDLYRMNKTAAEIREALNSGRGILVVYVEETDSVEGYKEVYGAPSAYSVASVNGVLQIEVEETYFFVEDPETGYMEASNQG